MERMTTALNLNKDQKKQVKTIMDDGQKEAGPVRDQIAKGRLAVAQAVAAGKSQDDINAAITELAGSQAQMTQIELHTFNKVFQALDKEQQAKAPAVLGMMNGIFKGKNWDATPAAM
jgi:Spy/CpxP family protein refolding chaperone